MKVIYFAGGMRFETLKLVHQVKDFTITKIVVADIEPNVAVYKQFAYDNNITLIVPTKKNLMESLKYDNEDILLSVGYRYIIPPSCFSQFTYAINIHPSLLPKYRGAYSGFAIIENGEKETGLTAHFIDDGIDSGDIISQYVINIEDSDTLNTVNQKLQDVEPNFVRDVLLDLKEGNIKRKENKIIPGDVIHSHKRQPTDSELDPTKSINSLFNKIRACDQNNFPAYAYVKGVKIILTISSEHT
jgi:methionyl-tRNA formyltransferase